MASVADLTIDFYEALFLRIFFEPFQPKLPDRRRRDAVKRQVLEGAAAASQSLERFFTNQQLTHEQIECILAALASMTAPLTLEQIASPYALPEKVVQELLVDAASDSELSRAEEGGYAAVYRVALYSVVQALMQIGPVMAEWQNIGFPSTFELSNRVIRRLNEISDQLNPLGGYGAAADERYELLYRDYLSQRFYRVEAGTVRMTTNLAVDLRELFVMPRVLERRSEPGAAGMETDGIELMPLSRARSILASLHPTDQQAGQTRVGTPILEHVKQHAKNVIVGLPGSGKSTFLEWFQLKIAAAEEEFVLGGQQAIPLLLRVRQFDLKNLPSGAALVENATNSRDFAMLMPQGWIDRQMSQGKVVFLLDGLDEVEPVVRDAAILPWFARMCKRYPDCAYVVSSRPVGYPAGLFHELAFTECDLTDFDEDQVLEYAKHWCAAIRLASNETLAEARREGATEGEQIVSGFKGNPYIESLARNPLMLSAICLVNYFEGGELPKDRAVLYKLCVEGLLHNWDQRRGIKSEYAFDEKLRACREVALHMQADDRAEYELERVQDIFTAVLKDRQRAEALLEHIRYRTGLLLERRSGVFAFAHLTFQEYLAARAIYEGNQLGIDAAQLVREHSDARWQEVIALFCGIAPAPVAREMMEGILQQPELTAKVLAEAYFSSGPELAEDAELRHRVIVAIAKAYADMSSPLSRFSPSEVAPIANAVLGQVAEGFSESFWWLLANPDHLHVPAFFERLKDWRKLTSRQVTELLYMAHRGAPDDLLYEVIHDSDVYSAPGPIAGTQAEWALQALTFRSANSPAADIALREVLRAIVASKLPIGGVGVSENSTFPTAQAWPDCAPLIRQLIARVEKESSRRRAEGLEKWYKALEERYGPPPDIPNPKKKKRNASRT